MKNMIRGLLQARFVIAQILFLNYPQAESMDDLPVELVRAFDAMTEIIKDYNTYISVAKFNHWWVNRTYYRDALAKLAKL